MLWRKYGGMTGCVYLSAMFDILSYEFRQVWQVQVVQRRL